MNLLDYLLYGADIHLFDLFILDDDYEMLNESAYPYKMAVDMILTGFPLI